MLPNDPMGCLQGGIAVLVAGMEGQKLGACFSGDGIIVRQPVFLVLQAVMFLESLVHR